MALSRIYPVDIVDWKVITYQDKYVDNTTETITFTDTTISNSSTNTSMANPYRRYVPVGVVGGRFLNESYSGTSGSGGTYCYFVSQYVTETGNVIYRATHEGSTPSNVSVLLYILMVKVGMVAE